MVSSYLRTFKGDIAIRGDLISLSDIALVSGKSEEGVDDWLSRAGFVFDVAPDGHFFASRTIALEYAMFLSSFTHSVLVAALADYDFKYSPCTDEKMLAVSGAVRDNFVASIYRAGVCRSEDIAKITSNVYVKSLGCDAFKLRKNLALKSGDKIRKFLTYRQLALVANVELATSAAIALGGVRGVDGVNRCICG